MPFAAFLASFLLFWIAFMELLYFLNSTLGFPFLVFLASLTDPLFLAPLYTRSCLRFHQ